jgi:hypothetical protein
MLGSVVAVRDEIPASRWGWASRCRCLPGCWLGGGPRWPHREPRARPDAVCAAIGLGVHRWHVPRACDASAALVGRVLGMWSLRVDILNVGGANENGEPNGEPTSADVRPHQATSSHSFRR